MPADNGECGKGKKKGKGAWEVSQKRQKTWYE